jgi:ribulose-5-phosphate 4-epimerase/fuculose-1-phosphate aldolase
VVIKPSGIDYEKLSGSRLVLADLQGRSVHTGEPGEHLWPSVDLPRHLYIYNNCPECGTNCSYPLELCYKF